MTTIVGYIYDADIHCPPCAENAHGIEPGKSWIREDAEDGEGNPVYPVFEIDEIAEPQDGCGTCGESFE